ncbi:MAG: phytanoyl-CoA dioxygenase family protein [Anaerolineae bacterium]|nr:phytanoyl-CoA dioxygenase family protein [Anaerolineae bacterium]
MTFTQQETTRLTNDERDQLNAQLARDGFAVLPHKLPADLANDVIGAIDRITAEQRQSNRSVQSVKLHNCVDHDPAFRRLMMYEPALQLAYDAFGPMFHLNQSNFISRVQEADQDAAKKDFAASIDWHADGPRPGLFPRVDGMMGLHYLKFGYFLTDLTHGTGGALQVIRGTHRHEELDGNKKNFNVADYADDLVEFNVEAGTVVVFHQALWHAAMPNQSEVERKNVYISYCPTWMRPVDRDFPAAADLENLSAEERWLLGEPRPAMRWWIPQGDDASRMARFARKPE